MTRRDWNIFGISLMMWAFLVAMCFYIPREVVFGAVFILVILFQARSHATLPLSVVFGLSMLGIHFHYEVGPGALPPFRAVVANQTLVLINSVAIWALCHRQIRLENQLEAIESAGDLIGYQYLDFQWREDDS